MTNISFFGRWRNVGKKLGVNALLPMLCRLRFSKSFQSDNHVYCESNYSTLDFLSSFIEIVFKLWNCAGHYRRFTLWCYTSSFFKVSHGLPCWILGNHALITWLQVLNRVLLCSVPCCLLFDDLFKETTCKYLCTFIQTSKGHGWSLVITWYTMASLHEPCEGSRHFIENDVIHRVDY